MKNFQEYNFCLYFENKKIRLTWNCLQSNENNFLKPTWYIGLYLWKFIKIKQNKKNNNCSKIVTITNIDYE